jgi:hypothetical protein
MEKFADQKGKKLLKKGGKLSMRSFEHIAKLIKNKRINHPKGYSQSELSNLLGYKNGQFISNVERALCNVPLKMLGRVSDVLDINPEDLKQAMINDLNKTLENYLKQSQRKTNQKPENLITPENSESSTWKQAA